MTPREEVLHGYPITILIYSVALASLAVALF